MRTTSFSPAASLTSDPEPNQRGHRDARAAVRLDPDYVPGVGRPRKPLSTTTSGPAPATRYRVPAQSRAAIRAPALSLDPRANMSDAAEYLDRPRRPRAERLAEADERRSGAPSQNGRTTRARISLRRTCRATAGLLEEANAPLRRGSRPSTLRIAEFRSGGEASSLQFGDFAKARSYFALDDSSSSWRRTPTQAQLLLREDKPEAAVRFSCWRAARGSRRSPA